MKYIATMTILGPNSMVKLPESRSLVRSWSSCVMKKKFVVKEKGMKPPWFLHLAIIMIVKKTPSFKPILSHWHVLTRSRYCSVQNSAHQIQWHFCDNHSMFNFFVLFSRKTVASKKQIAICVCLYLNWYQICLSLSGKSSPTHPPMVNHCFVTWDVTNPFMIGPNHCEQKLEKIETRFWVIWSFRGLY